MDINEYSDLTGIAFEAKEQIAPEDEFFHSVYISGQTRKNHIGIIEQTGKLQIRGADYNLDEVLGIITHTKSVLVNSVQKQGRESTECFSWCDGVPPWKSSTGRMCGKNSAERASVDFCKNCRAQIIVALLRCNPDGTLVLTPEKKPLFMFIRGKGTKYSNVSEYLNSLAKLDMDPIFTPVTPATTQFEKSTVNHKRFVTKITIGWVQTKFGNKAVYELEKLNEIAKEQIPSLLKGAKQTVSKFNEKFDWSVRKTGGKPFSEGPNAFGEIGNETAKMSISEAGKKEEAPKAGSFSFDDVDF
jgi:hypothetical protein